MNNNKILLYRIILINAALRSHWTLSNSEASPRIWTCATRPSRARALGLGMRLLWVVYHMHSYDFEMDTKKQRQHRCDDARLTKSGNARSEQLNTRGAYRVTNQQSLACLSGSESQRPGWFLDINLFDESSVKIFTAQGQRGGCFLE